MQKYIGTAIKKDVNNPEPIGETPAVNVDVRVVVTSTGALANIYSDNGTTIIDQNNYKTDANGNHEFYAENGRYTIRYLLADGTVEYTDISLFDIDDYNPPSSGEANTASNEGDGAGLVMPKVGVNLPFKTIKVIGGTITEDANSITIEIEAQKMFRTIDASTVTVSGEAKTVTVQQNQRIAIFEVFVVGDTSATDWNITSGNVNLNPSGTREIVKTPSGDNSVLISNTKFYTSIGEGFTITAGAGVTLSCVYYVEEEY